MARLNFTDMLTLPSGQCETNKQVCEQLGLLQDDGEWIEVLSESALTMSLEETSQPLLHDHRLVCTSQSKAVV